MKAVIAIDSLKGSLSSMEAGDSIREGILKAIPNADVTISPLADGGEGTVETLVSGMHGTLQNVSVTGPLGESVICEYGIIKESNTAVIEMAGAAGITLVPQAQRNPLNTTTYGVGEVILDAIQRGCRRFLVGIGGSATNDGGIGMLQALGYVFMDEKKNPVSQGAKGLKDLVYIDDTKAIPELEECSFYVACDVTNPLCGPHGCSAVFGPQKGADSEMIKKMDQWMKNYAELAKKQYHHANPEFPGAGAAGGLGFAFLTFLNAKLKSGIQIIIEETGLEDKIKDADIIITGEGRLDGQSAMGKAPVGVATLAKKYGKPVIAFAGSVTEDAKMCNEKGIDAFFPILRSIITLEDAMAPENARKNMSDTAEQVFRLLNMNSGIQ